MDRHTEMRERERQRERERERTMFKNFFFFFLTGLCITAVVVSVGHRGQCGSMEQEAEFGGEGPKLKDKP